MPDTVTFNSSLAVVQAAPTRIAEVLKTYSREVSRFEGRPALPIEASQDERIADQVATRAELAYQQQQTLERLQRLENSTRRAIIDARDHLEAAILPVMSTDPQVQRVFELRQVKALARFRPLFERATTEAEVDQIVRQFADEAARQSDWATLRALRTEIAPILSRLRIDPATSEALRIIERTVAAVRPRATAALAERRALDLGAARVAVAFSRALAAVVQQEREVELPGYADNVSETIVLPVS